MKNMIMQISRKIVANKEAFAVYARFAGMNHLCAHRLESAAGNHAFDDHPEAFDITEQEGHHIRAFFQQMPLMEAEKCQFRKMVDDWIDEAIEPISRRRDIAEKAAKHNDKLG